MVESSNSGQDQQKRQEQSQQAQQRSRLVAKLLAAGPDIREFMHDLLHVQAIVVNGTEAAGFLLEPGEGGSVNLRNVVHIRPDSSDEQTRRAALQAFTEIVGECLKQGKDGVIDVGAPNESIEPQFCLVTLLRNNEQVVAASCVITRARDQERAQQRLETMRLVAGYFDMWLLKRANETQIQTTQRHQDVLQSAAAFANGETFNGASANLCNELVTRTGASRVSLGWVKIRSVKLLAMSHTEQFDRRQELSVSIVTAMEECVDQGELVQYDPDPSGNTTNNITRSAQALSRLENGNKIVSLPLRHKNEVVGVLTLEYPPTVKLTPHMTTSLAVTSEVLAPQIFDRYENDRWLPVKVGKSIVHNSKYIIGPRHTLAKVIFFGVIALTLFVFLYSPMYHVSAPFQFSPIVKRTISAPMEGKIEEVFVKPGDAVTKGQKLLKFDTSQLADQREELQMRMFTALKEADDAENDKERPDMSKAVTKRLEAKGIASQIKVIDAKISRATIVSPIDGKVLKGDLEEKTKSTVKEGDQLLDVAQPELEAEIRVGERDIQMLTGDSVGEIATTSNPSDGHKIKINRIVPLGEAKEAKNVFRVYATIESPATNWYPGQEGEARIDWQPKSLAWQGTHRLWEWLRMKLWI